MCISGSWVLLVAAAGLGVALGGSEVSQGSLKIPLCCPEGTRAGGPQTVDMGDKFLDRVFCHHTSDPSMEEFEPMKSFLTRHYPLTCKNLKYVEDRSWRKEKRGNRSFGVYVEKVLSKPAGKTLCFDFTDGRVDWYFCSDMPKIPQAPGVNWTFTVASGLSILLLIITAILYSTVGPLTKNPHSPYIVAHNLSLAMAYVCRILIQFILVDEEIPQCQYIAFASQFFTLSAFFWMSAMCLDVHITIRNLLDHEFVTPIQDYSRMVPPTARKSPCNKKYVFLSLYAWGVPLIITTLAICFELSDAVPSDSPFKPNIARWRYSCFFTGSPRWILFRAPILVSVVISVALFIATAVGLYQHERNMAGISQQQNSNFSTDKRYFILYLKLFVIMGVGWGFGWAMDTSVKYLLYITDSTLPSFMSYVFIFTDLVFCLQGVFIFILFVCKKRTLKVLLEQFQSLRFLRCSTRGSEDSSSGVGDNGITGAESKETIL